MSITNTTLAWTANSETDLAGYHVYWSLDAINYTASGAIAKTVTSFSLDYLLLSSDGLYYFTIDAFDTSGNSSARSSRVTKRITRNTGTITVTK